MMTAHSPQPTAQAAPAPSVSAPAPQGTLAGRKLRVVVFDMFGGACRSLKSECRLAGCEVTEVRVQSAEHSRLIKNDTYLVMPEGNVTRGVCTAENAAKIIAEIKPDIVCTPGVKDVDGKRNSFVDLLNSQIPNIIPLNVEHLVDTASGYIIDAKDGRDGHIMSDREINVAKFLAAKAQKVAQEERGRAG